MEDILVLMTVEMLCDCKYKKYHPKTMQNIVYQMNQQMIR